MRSETSFFDISSNEKFVFLLQREDVGTSARIKRTTATAVSDAQIFLIPNMSANFSPKGDMEHFPYSA